MFTTTCAALALAAPGATGENVLIILADDMGTEVLERYGLRGPGRPGAALGYPDTPNIDALADAGILFENGWANPVCSPTRATIQTGQYGCTTRIGDVIENGEVSLPDSPDNLAALLSEEGYATGAFGKWHLEDTFGTDVCAPITVGGYGHFEGTLYAVKWNASSSYCSFPDRLTLDVDGSGGCLPPIVEPGTAYLTCDTMQAAADWIAPEPGPWLCYLAPQAPYELEHAPPDPTSACGDDCGVASLHGQPLCTPAGSLCNAGCQPDERVLCYFAAVEALDTQIGAVLAAIPNWTETTTVFFLGDNGTPNDVNEGIGYWPKGAKETLYEGGVNVPFIVAGASVNPNRRGSRSLRLVQSVDVYRTAVAIGGATAPPVAGKNLLPFLQAPMPYMSLTEKIYAERFRPNLPAGVPCSSHEQAIRNYRYKVIRDPGGDQFYDLWVDPRESGSGAVPGPNDPKRPFYEDLVASFPCACDLS